MSITFYFKCKKEVSVYLNLGHDGQDRDADTEEHVDADEDLVLGAAV